MSLDASNGSGGYSYSSPRKTYGSRHADPRSLSSFSTCQVAPHCAHCVNRSSFTGEYTVHRGHSTSQPELNRTATQRRSRFGSVRSRYGTSSLDFATGAFAGAGFAGAGGGGGVPFAGAGGAPSTGSDCDLSCPGGNSCTDTSPECVSSDGSLAPSAFTTESGSNPASTYSFAAVACFTWMSATSLPSSRRNEMSRSSYQRRVPFGTFTSGAREPAAFRHHGRAVRSAI